MKRLNTAQKIVIVIIVVAAILGCIVYSLYQGLKQREAAAREIASNSTLGEDLFEKYDPGMESQNTENATDSNASEENIAEDENALEKDENSQENEIADDQEEKETGKEKAIALAKKKWGQDDSSVTYKVEEHKGNEYQVSVNDKKTTAALAWYKVNIKTGEVSEY